MRCPSSSARASEQVSGVGTLSLFFPIGWSSWWWWWWWLGIPITGWSIATKNKECVCVLCCVSGDCKGRHPPDAVIQSRRLDSMDGQRGWRERGGSRGWSTHGCYTWPMDFRWRKPRSSGIINPSQCVCLFVCWNSSRMEGVEIKSRKKGRGRKKEKSVYNKATPPTRPAWFHMPVAAVSPSLTTYPLGARPRDCHAASRQNKQISSSDEKIRSQPLRPSIIKLSLTDGRRLNKRRIPSPDAVTTIRRHHSLSCGFSFLF